MERRKKTAYFIDIVLLIMGIGMMVTGILMVNPVYAQSRTVVYIHILSGLAFTAFALVHILLNVRWMASMTKRIFLGRRQERDETGRTIA